MLFRSRVRHPVWRIGQVMFSDGLKIGIQHGAVACKASFNRPVYIQQGTAFLAALAAHIQGSFPVMRQFQHSFPNGCAVSYGNNIPGFAVLDVLRLTSFLGSDDRQAHHTGFLHNVGGVIAQCRMHQAPCGRQMLLESFPRNGAQPMDIGSGLRL